MNRKIRKKRGNFVAENWLKIIRKGEQRRGKFVAEMNYKMDRKIGER